MTRALGRMPSAPSMANTYFDPGDRRAVMVNKLFTRIARRYDLINDLQSFGLHRFWKRHLARLARVHPGARALDVCCGTGDLSFELARLGADVVGLDFNEHMLAVARGRTTESRGSDVDGEAKWRSKAPTQPGLEFLQGNALDLPFPDRSFDIVTVGYGLRNLSDWRVGLAEMRRVSRPGGRILALDFGKPDNRLWRCLYFSYLRLFVPMVGLVFCGSASAYAYILESLKHYPAQHGIDAEMRRLGLVNTRIVSFLGGVMTINCAEAPPALKSSETAPNER